MQLRLYGFVALGITVVTFIIVRQFFDWRLYLMVIAALSVATFVLYGLDKGNARLYGNQAQYRVPKNLLHLMALLGGFPGGWLGMFLFWHKVRQPDFWAILIGSTVLHTFLLFMTAS